MSRIIKEPEIRRKEILGVAQRLVYSVGYGQMTIQDILDDLHLSKGAFYHYFDSKQALLEALIEQTGEEGIRLILPILTDPSLNALQKIQSYFDSSMRWKTAQKPLMIALMKSWYSDDNALLRQKALAAGKKTMTRLLTDVLRQGIGEGVFAAPYPEQTAEVLVSLILGLTDALAGLILAGERAPVDPGQVEATVAAFTLAAERVLGAAPASLKLIDLETMQEWFN